MLECAARSRRRQAGQHWWRGLTTIKGLLGKEDAARLQEERAREERRRHAAEAADEIAKERALKDKKPASNEWKDFFD